MFDLFQVKYHRSFCDHGLTMGRRITHYPFRDRARMGEQRWVQKTIRAACGIRAYGASVRYVTCIDCRQLIELRMFAAERDIQALAPQPGEHPRRARANATCSSH